MTREEYHAECLALAIEAAGCAGLIQSDKIAEIAKAFKDGLDMEAESFGDLNIPNPQTTEIRELRDKMKKKDDALDDVERAYGEKLLSVAGLSPDGWWVTRRDGRIEITRRR